MGIFSTDSLLGVVLTVVAMLGGGAIVITVMALAASELMRLVFVQFGDSEEFESDETADSAGV